jgi:hypothetical protein
VALTVTTDLTDINLAEATTDWAKFGSGGGTPALEPDFHAQGSNCISLAVSNSNKGIWYDIGSGNTLNFAASGGAENMLVYMWIKIATPGLIAAIASGGLAIRLGSGATGADWSEWYVGGNDFGLEDTDGFKMFIVDPTTTASTTAATAVDLTAVRWFGARIDVTAAAKGQNIGIDAIRYGRGVLRGTGTATTDAGFQDLSDGDWGNNSNRYGIIVERSGIMYVKGKIVIGDDSGSLATTFTDTNTVLVWETPMYHNGTNRVKAIPDEDEDGLGYWGLDIVGNGTGDTAMTMGVVVGTDNGRSGPTLQVATNAEINSGSDRQGWRFTRTTAVEDMDIYGATFRNLERADEANAISFENCDVNDKIYGTTFDSCGRIHLGAAEARNCNFLNSIVGTLDGGVFWNNNTNCRDSLFVNPAFHSIVVEAVPSPALTFTNLTFGTAALAVRYEGATNTTGSIDGGTTGLTAEDGGAGNMTFSSSVNMKVTVVDEGGTGIVGAQVGIFDAADNTQYMNEATTTGGIAEESYTGTTPKTVSVRVRYAPGGTDYLPVNTTQTVQTNTGLDVTITLIADPINLN